MKASKEFAKTQKIMAETSVHPLDLKLQITLDGEAASRIADVWIAGWHARHRDPAAAEPDYEVLTIALAAMLPAGSESAAEAWCRVLEAEIKARLAAKGN